MNVRKPEINSCWIDAVGYHFVVVDDEAPDDDLVSIIYYQEYKKPEQKGYYSYEQRDKVVTGLCSYRVDRHNSDYFAHYVKKATTLKAVFEWLTSD